MLRCPWACPDCFVAHLMCLKMIRNKSQCPWAVAHYLTAYFLPFKMSLDSSSPPWNIYKQSQIYLYPFSPGRGQVLWAEKFFCIRSQDTKEIPCLCPQCFCITFFIFWHTPVPISWWVPSNRHWLFFYWGFLSLSFFISIIPLKKLSSSSSYAVSSYRIHMLFLVTNQSGTYFSNHGSFSMDLSHISCVLKWSKTHLSSHGSTFTHFLCFKVVWNKF